MEGFASPTESQGQDVCWDWKQGKCWKKAHSNDPKIRAKLKKKRVQPTLASGDKVATRRVTKKRRQRQPAFEEGEEDQ